MEYRKNISSLGKYDVAVLGGGPAGTCAAIEAARNGAKVILIEDTGALGGMATAAKVGPFMTSYDREGDRPIVGGLFREITTRLAKNNYAILPENTDSPSIHTSFIQPYHRHVTPFDSFQLEILLDDMTKEAGVEVLLYTRFADSVVENGKIKSVVVAALEGLRTIEAEIFIDCTGKADVADASGVNTWKGNENTGEPQPGTLMFEVHGVKDSEYQAKPKAPVKAYRTPIEGHYTVNHEHVYDVDAACSKSMTLAHQEARKQVVESMRVLNEETPGFEDAKIAAVAPVLGVRESRHIEGLYRITVDDVSKGTVFEDRIAVYGFGMDVHTRTSEITIKNNFKVQSAIAYYVPYRSMIPIGCDNLIVAGKTISCESQAAGGLRCMPCAMSMGQAAGLASSFAVKQHILPKDVNIKELQKILVSHGAIID